MLLNSCLLQPCLSWKYKRNVHCGSQGPWCFQSLPGTLARNCWRGLLQQRTLKTGGQMLSWSIYCLSDWAWWVAGCKKKLRRAVQLCMHLRSARICWRQSSVPPQADQGRPPSSHAQGHRPAELSHWSASWIFNQSALWHVPRWILHQRVGS